MSNSTWKIRKNPFPLLCLLLTVILLFQLIEQFAKSVNLLHIYRSEPWDYSEPFDYIHTRTTGACWESFETQIAQQAFDTLTPGGWFESQELYPVPHCDDGTLKPDSALGLWFRDFLNAAAQAQRPLTEACNLRSIYERVGFVNVHERVYKVPLNGWAKDAKLKEVGNMMEMNMQMGLSAFSLGLFNRIYGQTPEQIEVKNITNVNFQEHNMANSTVDTGIPCRSPTRCIRSIDSRIRALLCRLG